MTDTLTPLKELKSFSDEQVAKISSATTNSVVYIYVNADYNMQGNTTDSEEVTMPGSVAIPVVDFDSLLNTKFKGDGLELNISIL